MSNWLWMVNFIFKQHIHVGQGFPVWGHFEPDLVDGLVVCITKSQPPLFWLWNPHREVSSSPGPFYSTLIPKRDLPWRAIPMLPHPPSPPLPLPKQQQQYKLKKKEKQKWAEDPYFCLIFELPKDHILYLIHLDILQPWCPASGPLYCSVPHFGMKVLDH